MSSKFDSFEKQKFLYFRSATSLGSDKRTSSGDTGDDTFGSICVPVKDIVAFYPGNQLNISDNKLTIAFKSIKRIMSDGANGNNLVHDMVVLNLVNANTHRDVITTISKLIADPYGDDFIVIADVFKKEFIAGVNGVETIAVADPFVDA